MPRLFITSRELDFISDITKEIVKDVIGEKIYYYKVREDLSNTHDVYEEATKKVFDPPIEIGARIEWDQATVTTNNFGQEQLYNIDVYIQSRDLLSKGIEIDEGDFFSYGDTFYEVVSYVYDSLVFGQIEHSTGVKLVGKQTRRGLIDQDPIGPTDESYSDPGAVQETFVQQRGFSENSEGPTGDEREMIKKGKLTLPISGPAEVSPEGGDKTSDTVIDSSFYDES